MTNGASAISRTMHVQTSVSAIEHVELSPTASPAAHGCDGAWYVIAEGSAGGGCDGGGGGITVLAGPSEHSDDDFPHVTAPSYDGPSHVLLNAVVVMRLMNSKRW